MVWHDLLFAHWPLEPNVLRGQLPRGLALDTFDGRAWIGVVPFRMSEVRPRCVPSLPGLSAFPELNLRTYVVAEGKPGVWFFSLDATSKIAVRYAQRFFHLPYRDARMEFRRSADGWIDYRSTRCDRLHPPAEFAVRYRPLPRPEGATAESIAPESLANWLTARFCLYAADRRGRLYRSEIDHAIWPLEPAEATIERNTLTEAVGITLPDCPPLLHFSRRLDTVAWTLEALK